MQHASVATIIHWKACKFHSFKHCKKRNYHPAQPVSENDDVKVLWDSNTDGAKIIEAWRPGIVADDKKHAATQVIHMAIAGSIGAKD